MRERERDGSDIIIVALKLAMSFALFLAKNLHLSFSLLIGADFTLSVAKCDRGSKQQNKRSNFRLHRPSHRKNESN